MMNAVFGVFLIFVVQNSSLVVDLPPLLIYPMLPYTIQLVYMFTHLSIHSMYNMHYYNSEVQVIHPHAGYGITGNSMFEPFFISFKNTYSAFSFDCMIRKVFLDHAIKWKSAVRIFERR